MGEAVFIAAAKRTAVGKFSGTLAGSHPARLGAAVIASLFEQHDKASAAVAEVVMGQVLQAGTGQNPARQAAVWAGLPETVPAMTLNMVCGSGMKAVHVAAMYIQAGEADVVVAGGQENMSQAPHVLTNSRTGHRLGDWTMIDTLLSDGLTCALSKQIHMGITAENLAEKYGLNREDQDRYAVASHAKASQAQKAGRFRDEIVPIEIAQRKGPPIVFQDDEVIRHDANLAGMEKLQPVFKQSGTVTAANSSGINDGAAALLLVSEKALKTYDLEPMVRIVAFASAGVDPTIMGIGPVPASRACLDRIGWTLDTLDLIEANEAFAAQSMAVNADMGWNLERVNVNGGAIALGHPIGASGARILVTLVHEMRRRRARRGLATMCIGGGQGIATAVELP